MKRIFLTSLILLSVAKSLSVQAGSLQGHAGFELGGGWKSGYGVLGLGARYFLTDQFDVHLNMSADLSGSNLGAGSRFYIYQNPSQSCFFVFSCEENYYLGATLLSSAGGRISIKNEDGEAQYDSGAGLAINAALGSYDVFSSGLTFGFEFGYRQWLSRPSFDLRSGTSVASHRRNLEGLVQDSLSFAIMLGWLF